MLVDEVANTFCCEIGCVPKGKLAVRRDEEDEAERRRQEIRRILSHPEREDIVVLSNGEMKGGDETMPGEKGIVVPKGKLAVRRDEEDEAARRRREIREKLRRGEEVVVEPDGEMKGGDETVPGERGIVVPKGKLAVSFYWYERDRELLRSEKEVMNHFFPQFKLEKLKDGRLSWVGILTPKHVRRNAVYVLQVIYDHNHPNNSTYGGSIKVYVVEPDLEKIQRELGQPIPHLLIDAHGHLYLCTARPEDVKVGKITTSAASAVAWAAKWITVFELWLAGDITTREFESHIF